MTKRSHRNKYCRTMVHYKLSYLELRGLAEPARQILAYAGEVFEDVRIERKDWPALKSKMPFGTVPVLHVDGKPLGQSHAIARYLARQFGLAGQNAWEEAQVNSIADLVKDYQLEIRPFFLVKAGFGDGDVEKLYREGFVPAFKKHYTFLTNALKANGSGFLVGDSLTWVDLVVAQQTSDVLATKNSLLGGRAELLDEFPELKEHQKKIHSIPRIAKWLQIRPVTPF
ncbi:unnamed protein product [Caenorhabditis sp. 36 PRJEB53466]|nr:unnamed protein product [Caenorhabditis sp. 36 PRJEB53466]